MVPREREFLVFLARHALAGIAVGWLLLAAVVWFDVASIGSLLWTTDAPVLTLLLAAGGFGVTFGSLAMGTAIFLLPRE